MVALFIAFACCISSGVGRTSNRQQPVTSRQLAYPEASFLAGTVVTPNSGTRVAVDRDAFKEKLRGRTFQDWKDFKHALGRDAEIQPDAGGKERFMSGLSLTFVIILNVLIWAVVVYVIIIMGNERPRTSAWIALGILCLYGCGVFCYCNWSYQHADQRLVTNFLFGLVPLSVSSASYILALLCLDYIRSSATPAKLFDSVHPFGQSFGNRFVFFLAVLPGLAASLHLGNTVSTGFRAHAMHFDMLSLCLFIDVGRFTGHLAYLLAPEWSLGKDPSGISSRPGLCYVIYVLCLAWYMTLVRIEAGGPAFFKADRTKVCTLACLTSFSFFPLAIYLLRMNLREFDDFVILPGWTRELILVCSVMLLATFMFLVAIVLDVIEPNLMGIGALLWVVFYSAYKISQGNLLGFILAMVPLCCLAFGALALSERAAIHAKEVILDYMAPSV